MITKGTFLLVLNVFTVALMVDAEPRKRAMWVWDLAKTGVGLPADDTLKPTQQQRAANKKANKIWDGASIREQVAENYKGIEDLFLDFCEAQSVSEVYMFGSVWEWHQSDLKNGRLPGEDRWIDFNREARQRGLKVWLCYYLWDTPDDARLDRDSEGMRAHAEAVHNFNQAHPESAFAGIHCDQEPKDQAHYVGLLNNMERAQNWIDENNAGILNSVALRPVWRKHTLEWQGSELTMNAAILSTISHAALMCYNDNLKTVNVWSDELIELATEKGKTVAIGFEANNLSNLWKNSHRETWWEEIDAEGIEVFEEALNKTAERHKEKPGFDRMVIHSYNGYFKHCHGLFPRDYIESLPKSKYVSGALK